MVDAGLKILNTLSIPQIINLPILGGIKHCKSMVKFEGFHLNSALFGLVI